MVFDLKREPQSFVTEYLGNTYPYAAVEEQDQAATPLALLSNLRASVMATVERPGKSSAMSSSDSPASQRPASTKVRLFARRPVETELFGPPTAKISKARSAFDGSLLRGGEGRAVPSLAFTDDSRHVMRKEHKDTSVSLHPLTFEEAIEALATAPKRAGSAAEA